MVEEPSNLIPFFRFQSFCLPNLHKLLTVYTGSGFHRDRLLIHLCISKKNWERKLRSQPFLIKFF